MPPSITIRPAEGTWVVRARGAVIAESTAALALVEGRMDPVIYFPKEDVAMAFLDPSEKMSTCPHKGQASYYTVVGSEATVPDAAWSYETPLETVASIAGHLAFHVSDDLTVEQL